MKKIIYLIGFLLCMPAFAADNQYDTYAGFRIHKNENLAFSYDIKGDSDINIRKDNFGIGAVIGNRLSDNVKIEFESSYTGIQQSKYNTDFDFDMMKCWIMMNFDIWSNMFNMYVFQEFSGAIAPYAGLGVGFAGIWSDIDAPIYHISDSCFDLSYQIMFGVNFALNNRIDFNLGIKYQYYGDIEHELHGNEFATTDASGTEVYFGAVYKFGI